MHIPGSPGRQWLRFVVVVQRGKIAPGAVAAPQFGETGGKHEPEQQPPKEPQTDPWRRGSGWKSGEQLERRDERGQETGLQKQNIPLVTEKNPADVEQREIERPEQNQDGNRRDPGNQEQRQRRAAPAKKLKKTITRVPP